MKKIFFLIIMLIFLLQTCVSSVFADTEPVRVMSLLYDNSSSLICVTTKGDFNNTQAAFPVKYTRLSNPNRIYFDINNAVLIGEKQHLVFENSEIKSTQLAQFSTNPNTVRVVVTFEEDFETENLKLLTFDGNIILKIKQPTFSNNYFNRVYEEKDSAKIYSNIIVNSQASKKVEIPISTNNKDSNAVVNDIQKAFQNATLPNSDGKSYDSVVSVDVSSLLKLRTKYFVSQYIPKSGGLLISGIGQLTTAKMFYLSSPKRLVIDLPNTFIDRKMRNREVNMCPDNSCKDIAKIGQFNRETGRIVINSDNADKYLPVYSQDGQSLFLVNSDKLNHTVLSPIVSNLSKTYVKTIDDKTSELILSFTQPIVYSVVRKNDSVSVYLFNVRSYNEQELINTINKSTFKNMKISLLPQIGIRATVDNIAPEDVVNIEQGADSKAIKILLTRNKKELSITKKRGTIKNKVVLDAGHGGTDYGAIREGINEKDIAFDVTKRVEAILRSKGYKVALTRNEDVYVSLEERVERSEKEEPEIFVSIHVNSAVSSAPSGVETHYYHDYSKKLAETVHKHLAQAVSSKDRGLFKSMFYVINHTTDPAILVEIGFISNEDERNELITNERKQKTAKAIADGIIEYLKNNKDK